MVNKIFLCTSPEDEEEEDRRGKRELEEELGYLVKVVCNALVTDGLIHFLVE